MKTAFLTHPLFLEHDTGAHHPERADRLRAIEAHLRANGIWENLVHLPFLPATEVDLARCHTANHIARVRTIAQNGGGSLDADTIISPASFDAAILASGALLGAIDGVMSGAIDHAFVAARPCGHHAESGRDADSPWGFCLFNHVAVGARYAQHRHGLERVAILDFDVHHGNGTQEIFYDDGSVFFASIHESPLFPGTGRSFETGTGAGEGATCNIPLPPSSDGALYRLAWEQIGRELEKFSPQFIILSAGYDAHHSDPLAHMDLEIEDFAFFVSEAKKWASTLCEGRIVAVLEGGYNLDALAQSVAATLEVFRSDEHLHTRAQE
jgi:acetoin utilization deacetylase AcuC-like enzyme